MTFSEYQKLAISTDAFAVTKPAVDSHAFISKLLGLVGESGEVADKFKKIYRDKNGSFSKSDKKEITKELGDVLWYINALSCYMGIELDEIASSNLEKVLSRKSRGKISGNGDNR